MINSIKLKFFVWFVFIFAIIFAGLGGFLHYEFKTFTLNQIDKQLSASFHTIASPIVLEASQGQLPMELWELAHIPTGDFSEKLSGHYYQVISPEGEILSRSPSLGLADEHLPVVPVSKKPILQTIIGPDKARVRLFSQSLDLSDGTIIILQVGNSLEDTYSMLKAIRDIMIVTIPAVFILSGFVGLIITKRALRPLKTFSSRINQITEENLSMRVKEEGLVTELSPLAASFNTMISRIEAAFSRQRQFLSDASHELRTPTAIIKSYHDVILNRERTAEEYRAALTKIGEAVNRMCDIINRILVISRLESKTIPLKPVSMDLLDVMKDVLRLIEPSADSRQIKTGLTGSHVDIRGDREGLTEVFTNIMENAIKYNRLGGGVDIVVSEDKPWAIVSVTDTGIGIPAEEIPKIFDRFYRVDASRGQTVGSGLGLSIVKAIVEAHAGKIDVKSAVGKGSTFLVLLPI